MSTRPSRRTMLKTAGLAALAVPACGVSRVAAAAGPRFEGRETPKISLETAPGGTAPGASPDEAAAAAARRVLQLAPAPVTPPTAPIPSPTPAPTTPIARHTPHPP